MSAAIPANLGGYKMKKLLVAAAAFSCVPGIAMAQDAAPEATPAEAFSGFRGEARIGYETPTVSGDGDVYKIGSAASFGGEIGYDVAVSRTVTFGPYVQYELSSVELCDGGDCLGEKGNLTAGGRIGVAVGGKTALYVKLGYSSIELEASSGGVSESDSLGGVYGAFGAEFSVTKNVYINIEGSYADFGELYDSGINLQRRQVAAGVGFRF